MTLINYPKTALSIGYIYATTINNENTESFSFAFLEKFFCVHTQIHKKTARQASNTPVIL